MRRQKPYQPIHAVVIEVVREGEHGPFAVAKADPPNPDIEGSITFSLDDPVWHEPDPPQPGMYVALSRLRKKPKGWRANSARFLEPGECSERPKERR